MVGRALVKRFGDVLAVDHLDLEIRRGECFGLLGPNGAGKTTTVEMFEGLQEPDEGEIEVLGEKWPRGGSGPLRARLGIQLQETRFPEKLRVREVVTLFRSFYPAGLEPADAIGLVGLEEKSGALVRGLSGGQKQRLSLACALIGEPEILFLDEPTTGLDPSSRRQLWEIVETLKQRGATVLLTTHYMEEAARLCDRVAVVDHGRRLALGTPRELVASLGAEHVVEFELEAEAEPEAGADPEALLARARLDALPGVERIARDGATVRLTVREVHRAVAPLLERLAAERIAVRRLTTHHATLEDVFLSLTGRRLGEGEGEAAP